MRIIVMATMMLASCGGTSGWQTDAGADAHPPGDGAQAEEGTADAFPSDRAATDSMIADGPADVAASDGPVTDGAAAWVPYGLLSLNLHCLKLDGTVFTDNETRFAAIAQAAAAESVGAIVVQEACREGSVDAMALLESALEAATGGAWSSAWAFAHTAWAGTADEAEEGVGILARGTLEDVETLEYAVQRPLRRVAIGARLPATLGGIRLWSTHLEVVDATVRLAQARQTASALATMSAPAFDVVVGGDFNAAASEAPCKAMSAYDFRDLSDGLQADRIDHIYAHRGAGLEAARAMTVFDGTSYPVVSDHHGVLVTVAPTAPEPHISTVIRIRADVGWGHFLSVRGNRAPLDWTAGWPAVPTASSEWKLVLTAFEPGVTFEYKCLRDDVVWQSGPNATGTGGSVNEVVPVF